MCNKKVMAAMLLFLAVYFHGVIAYGVPAEPVVRTLKQADGTQFQGRLRGDEWLHWWETTNGYTIIFDEATGNWVYVAKINDRLVKTDLVVTKDPPPVVSKHLRPQKVSIAQIQNPLQPPRRIYVKVLPPSGTRRLPAILIDFDDTNPSFTPSQFNSMLFGIGTGSMRDYYREVSYYPASGSLDLTGSVYGWYDSSQGHDYYGNNVSCPWDPGNPACTTDEWPHILVREAVIAADSLVDFSQYDNDGDGYVDGVIVVHQGTDEAAGNGSPTDIWSHMWSLNGGQYWMGCPAWMTPCGEYITNDGVKVNTYTIQAEVASDWGMATVGVFAHETGHLLGLPDLYDYGYDSDGAGLWTLMAAGSWNSISRPGDSPAHLMAWEKWALGWLTPTAVTSPLISASISQVEDNAVAYQLLDNPGGPGDWFSDCTASSGEYFLVENRQRVGFDTALPGDGLLIWHIDESPIGSQCRYNNDQTHKLVDLEEASGPQDLDVMGDGNAGGPEDPYPGASNNRTFDDASDPNSKLYDGSPSGVCVANISDSGSTMTANMGISGCPAPGTPAVFRVTRGGDVYADRAYYCGLDSGCFNVGVGADIAEYIKVSEPVEPGDVVELDPDRPGYYRKSRGPYSTLAVGVISSTPGITMGPPEPQPPSWLTLSLDLFISHFGGPKLTLGGLSLQAVLEGKPLGLISIMIPHTGFIELASRYRLRDQPLLALMGVVPVKVTTENGPIQPGDLLISSSTPGYAMRCDEPKECEGAIIGKALEPLKEGTGVIKMLVMR